MPGPVPKRQEDRTRRNEPEIPVDTISLEGSVEVPDLNIMSPHPLAFDWYQSLKSSGEALYYEPSDWQTARLTAHFMSNLLKSEKPSAQMLMVLQSLMSDLLTTEGSRRRLRLEIERNKKKEETAEDRLVAEVIDVYSKMDLSS